MASDVGLREAVSSLQNDDRTLVAIDGAVFDISEFVLTHDGGLDVIVAAMESAAEHVWGVPDITASFSLAPHSARARRILDTFLVGRFQVPALSAPASSPTAPPATATGTEWWHHLPGPPPSADFPTDGNADDVLASLLAAHRLTERWDKLYGPVLHYRVHQQHVVQISDPAIMADVLQDNPRKVGALAEDVDDSGTRKNFYTDMKDLFGEGILTVSHARWPARRALLRPAFALPALAGLFPIILRRGQELVGRLGGAVMPAASTKHVRPAPFGTACPAGAAAVNMAEEFKAVAFGIIVDSLLPSTLPSRDVEGFRHAAEAALVNVYTRQTHLPSAAASLRSLYDVVDNLQPAVTESSRPRGPRLDVIERLAGARCPHAGASRGGDQLSPRDVSSELVTLLLAGHETSANTMAWLLFELARHPHLQCRAQAEVDALLDDVGEGGLEYTSLHRLPFLSACVFETLRLHSTVHTIARQAPPDTTLHVNGKDVSIPTGTTLVFSLWSMHRSPRWWGTSPPPDVFAPDRRWAHGAFKPFGVSPRDCLGRHLALHEIRLVMVLLLRAYSFRLPDKGVTPPREMSLLTVIPESGVNVHVVARSPGPPARL